MEESNHFDEDYDLRTITYLVHLQPPMPCLKYVFKSGLENHFIDHLLCLNILSNDMKSPALFISPSPGPRDTSHFICGIIFNNQLLLINPLGCKTINQDLRNVLRRVSENNLSYKINQIYLSSDIIQKDPEDQSSSGPICVELVNELNKNWQSISAKFEEWFKLPQSKGKEEFNDGKLSYPEVSIRELCITERLANMSLKSPVSVMTNIRKEHFNNLCALPIINVKSNQQDESPDIKNQNLYLGEKIMNALEQVLVWKMAEDSLSFSDLYAEESYKILCNRISSSVKSAQLSAALKLLEKKIEDDTHISDVNKRYYPRLCVDFAEMLITVSKRVKKNDGENNDGDHKVTREEVQYFIQSDDINKFLKLFTNPFRIFIGLSVGRYYHEGFHAESQIACINNLREALELCLQEEITKFDPLGNRNCRINDRWFFEIIKADSLQAINEIRDVKVNLLVSGQCVKMLLRNDNIINDNKNKFTKDGEKLEEHHRKLLDSNNQNHQKDVVINLVVENRTIEWCYLEKYYKDPLYLEMVNYLEDAFKYSILSRTSKDIKPESSSSKDTTGKKEMKRNKKSKPEVQIHDWEHFIEVKDLCYIITEIVMHYYIIFNTKTLSGEEEQPFILYPGPLNAMFELGKNLLMIKYSSHIAKPICESLHCERIVPGEKPSGLFSCSNDELIKKERVKYIKDHLKKSLAEITLAAVSNPKEYRINNSRSTRYSDFRSPKLNPKIRENIFCFKELDYFAHELLKSEQKNQEPSFFAKDLPDRSAQIYSLYLRAQEPQHLSPLSALFCAILGRRFYYNFKLFAASFDNSCELKQVQAAYQDMMTHIGESYSYHHNIFTTDYSLSLMSDLPQDGILLPSTIYLQKRRDILIYKVRTPQGIVIVDSLDIEATVDLNTETLNALKLQILKEISIKGHCTPPCNLQQREKNRQWHTRVLVEFERNSDNPICSLLIAARLETFDYFDFGVKKAINIYANLLLNNHFPCTQLSNLMRIGVGSSVALYAIGEYILSENFNNEQLQLNLIIFTNFCIQKKLTSWGKNNQRIVMQAIDNFKRFSAHKKHNFTEIALSCLELAVFSEGNLHVRAHAAKSLCTYLFLGIENILDKNTYKACLILDYVFSSASNMDKSMLLKLLKKLTKRSPQGPWIDITFAKFYNKLLALENTVNSSKEKIQLIIQHLKYANESLKSIHYRGETELKLSFNEVAYNCSMTMLALTDTYKDNIPFCAVLYFYTEELLWLSANNGFCLSNWKLAQLLETRLGSHSTKYEIDRIDLHYQRALKGIISVFFDQYFEEMLSSYQNFLLKLSSQLDNISYNNSRISDLRLNILALKNIAQMKNAHFFSFFYTSADKLKFEERFGNSLLAISFLWDINVRFSKALWREKLIKELDGRGLLDEGLPNCINNFITYLSDYFMLVKIDMSAKVFFTCLEEGLKNTSIIKKERTRKKLIALVDFYINIIDSNFKNCQETVNLYIDMCETVYDTLNRRCLLSAEKYSSLVELIVEPFFHWNPITQQSESQIFFPTPK